MINGKSFQDLRKAWACEGQAKLRGLSGLKLIEIGINKLGKNAFGMWVMAYVRLWIKPRESDL